MSDHQQDPQQVENPPADRLTTLEQRLQHLEAETLSLRETVRELSRTVAARGEVAPRPAAAAPPEAAAAHSVSQHLASRQAARAEEPAKAPPPPTSPAPPAALAQPAPAAPRTIPTMEQVMAAAPQKPAPPPRPQHPPRPPRPARPPIALEDIMAKGLLGVGGIVLLLGGVFGAVLILPHLPPVARVALGYLVAAALMATGFGLSFKALWPGRVVLMIGIAFGFFTSFAAGFLPITAVVPPFVSVALMFVFVGALAVCSEAWKSESVAGFGFLLGLIAALASAPTSQATTLIALVILSIGAGALLVRHEWKHLNAAALVCIALGTLLMWMIAPVPQEGGAVLAHLGALACYYIVFTLAFASWGRVVLARERLAIEAPEQFATPVIKIDAATVAYSSVFAQVNSVVFGALAIWLLLFTEVFWPHVYLPLIVMAVLEAGRLVVPVLRRGTLLGFHTVTSLGLVASAVVAYFSGLAESAVLALMTMVVAMLASRSAMLGWLRPLTLITAFLTLPGFNPSGATTPIEFLARLMPALFLLASVLPWESIAVMRPRRLSAGIIEIFEMVSGNGRAAIASVMLTFVLMDWFSPDGATIGGMIVIGKSVLLLLGLLLLGAWNWFLAVALAVVFGTVLLGIGMESEPEHGYWLIVAGAFWALLCTVLWHEITRQTTSTAGRILVGLASICITVSLAVVLLATMPAVPDWNGLLVTIMALAVGGVGLMAERTGNWPRLLPEATLDENQWSITTHRRLPDSIWKFVRVSWGLGAVLALGGWFQVIGIDSATQLVSAALVTAAWCGLWHVSTYKASWPVATRWIFAFAAIMTICPALIVADDGRGASVAAVFIFATAALLLGMIRREKSMLLAGVVWLIGLGFLSLAALLPERYPTITEAWLVVAAGVAAIILAATLRRRLDWCRFPKNIPESLRGLILASGVLCALIALASGATMPGYLATASWGLLAALLLVGGFAARDAMLRYAAFAVFVLAIGRIIVIDMARMDMFTKFMALFGLGLLMLMGGVAYWFLRPKSGAARGSEA